MSTRRSTLHHALLAALCCVIAGCGGGGSDPDPGAGTPTPPPPGPGNNPPPASAEPTLSVTSPQIQVSAAPGQSAPTATITATVTNRPTGTLYVAYSHGVTGVAGVAWAPGANASISLTVTYRLPGDLDAGTYSDDVSLRVCLDEYCTQQIAGSPAIVRSNYQVQATGTSTVSISNPIVSATADSAQQTSVSVEVPGGIAPEPQVRATGWSQHTGVAIRSVVVNTIPGSSLVRITFKPGSELGPGTHRDTVTVRVCYDVPCKHVMVGSPFTINTTFEVTRRADDVDTPLPLLGRKALPHNVLDAEYSRALDQIVMVASYPANALHLYDVAGGTERSVALARTPTAVSVSPDGRRAAVGHNGKISIVDLDPPAGASPPVPLQLDVSTDVYDLVLDGRGVVHAFSKDPFTDQKRIRSIHVASNTETMSHVSDIVREQALARLHPSGDYLYVDGSRSGGDFGKWNITSGVPVFLYRPPFVPNSSTCWDIWFNTTGTRLFTSCGAVLRSSAVQSEDFTSIGKLPLSASSASEYNIASLDHLGTRDEIALVEFNRWQCPPYDTPNEPPCQHHLGIFDGASLQRLAMYNIGPITVSGTGYAQRGLFVFYKTDGSRKYLLSRLAAMPNPNAEFYVTELQ